MGRQIGERERFVFSAFEKSFVLLREIQSFFRQDQERLRVTGKRKHSQFRHPEPIKVLGPVADVK